jgi:[protein-PII] uridylyltransferase
VASSASLTAFEAEPPPPVVSPPRPSADSVDLTVNGPIFAISGGCCGEEDPSIGEGDRLADPGEPSTLLSETKIYVDRHQRALAAMIDSADPTSGGEALAKRHACIVDGIVRALFAAGKCRLEHRKQRSVGPIAFGAVGSYGRGRVGLASGHGMRVVFDEEGRRSDAISLAVATLEPVRTCGVVMDVQVIGLRDFVEQARGDLEVALSALDFRHLVGDAAVSQRLWGAVSSALSSDCAKNLLVEALVAERLARHGRAARVGILDVRASRGALRDLDVLGWLSRAATATADSQEAGPPASCGLEKLLTAGIWTAETLQSVEAARDLLWRVRNRLHLRAARRDDLLDDARAEALAPGLGFRNGAALLGEVTLRTDQVDEATSRLLEWMASSTSRRCGSPQSRRGG